LLKHVHRVLQRGHEPLFERGDSTPWAIRLAAAAGKGYNA